MRYTEMQVTVAAWIVVLFPAMVSIVVMWTFYRLGKAWSWKRFAWGEYDGHRCPLCQSVIYGEESE